MIDDESMQLTSISKSEVSRNQLQVVRPAAISLICLFQILTACCIFFACLRVSPLLAVIGTIISTPAIIRTGLVSDLYRKSGMRFGWCRRLITFAHSVWLVFLTSVVSFIVFAAISMAFGLACVGIAFACGSHDLVSDIAVVGTFGGMVWGVVGGLLATGFSAKWWTTNLRREPRSLHQNDFCQN